MIIAKQMDIRSNIKKYFDLAYDGEIIFVPRKESRNIVIISEDEYNRISSNNRLDTYARSIAHERSVSFSSSINSVKEDNLKKLDLIESLKENWNGNDAPPIPSDVIGKTRALLNILPIQPEIFPTALSTIQLEYDNSRHDHMEIEIGRSDIAEIFIVNYFGSEFMENITIDKISERVIQFYG